MLLYYTIPYHSIAYYTILYYTILYYTILYYTILYYTILYYTMPYYKEPCYNKPSLWATAPVVVEARPNLQECHRALGLGPSWDGPDDLRRRKLCYSISISPKNSSPLDKRRRLFDPVQGISSFFGALLLEVPAF